MTSTDSTGQRDVEPDVAPWPGRWLLYLLGAGLLTFGLGGIVRDTHGWTHPVLWAALLVAAAVAHDLVLVPLVFALGRPLSRLTSAGTRRYLATGLGLSLVLLVLAWPGLHSTGRPDNPSVLPLDYGHGLGLSLLVLWSGLFTAYVLTALRAELRQQPPGSVPHRRPG